MSINKLLIILLLCFPARSYIAQELKVTSLSLTGISFPIGVSNVPDSLTSLNFTVANENISQEFSVLVKSGRADTMFSLPASGNFSISISELPAIKEKIRVLPGWLSIVPPLLAILLALIIRQVLIALAAGIYVGAIFIYDFNPVIALLRFADVFIVNALIDRDHMFVILFTLLIGGVVGIISRNGGTAGLANLLTKFARTAKSGMISSWLMGIVVFFDDYANSLIIGNMMRPITDKLKISREKLSYIVDSTAAPIASIVIISTWIGYELGLIAEGLRSINSAENAYDVFINTLPYRFYPIAALFFVFITSYFERDFGAMYRAEKRARSTGKLFADGAKIVEFQGDDKIYKKHSRWYNGVIPILVILLGTIAGLYYTGSMALLEKGITDHSIQAIISNSDSFYSLLWASFAACVVAIIMTVSQKIMKLNEVITAWHKGVQSMLIAVIILTFAWAISTVTNEMKTADYLISILSDTLNPRLLPVLVFFICGFISFSTGTSWGTMAIVMPIVIPLSYKMSAASGLNAADSTLIIHGVVSSVLTGSVFGDHCSPIADTTILSSMASHCNHIDHVKTQLPYAILVGVFCMLIGDLPTAFGLNPFISIALIFASLTAVLFIFGKRLPKAV